MIRSVIYFNFIALLKILTISMLISMQINNYVIVYKHYFDMITKYGAA